MQTYSLSSERARATSSIAEVRGLSFDENEYTFCFLSFLRACNETKPGRKRLFSDTCVRKIAYTFAKRQSEFDIRIIQMKVTQFPSSWEEGCPKGGVVENT